jgi:hypothetical protein
VDGTEIEILIEGVWKGGTLSEFTGEDGHAEFETAADYEDSRELWITVRDQRFGPYDISEEEHTVQLD